MDAPRPILTSEWRWLAMLNFPVHPAVLLPHLPAGTRLDRFQGRTLVSIVGFHYFDTRLHGWAILGHRSFAEVNLRFHVKRLLPDGTTRRGVAFLREVAPRRAVAWVANWLYGESFVVGPVSARLDQPDRWTLPAGEIEYRWRHRGCRNRLAFRAGGEPRPLVPGSEEEFIAEHYWAYTRLDARRTIEYQVTHPAWRWSPVHDLKFECDVSRMYGAKYQPFLTAAPTSAFLAEGSAVRVYPGRALTSAEMRAGEQDEASSPANGLERVSVGSG